MASRGSTRRWEAVLFDVGQTLLRVEPSVGHVYAAAARRYGVEAHPDELERAFRRLWKDRRDAFPDNRGHASSEDEERAWWRDMVKGVFRYSGNLDALGSRFDAYFDDVFEAFAWPRVWHVFEDVAPALDELDRLGLRKALVSNWDQRLHVLLSRLGLHQRFEFVLTSAEAGRRKPHPAIFRAALERLGLPAEGIAYIGDSYADDVVGAQEVGMRPVLLDRFRDRSDADHLATLKDLSAWLAGDFG